jgi:hypothetical protein
VSRSGRRSKPVENGRRGARATAEARARWLVEFARRDLRQLTAPEQQILTRGLLTIAVPWSRGGLASRPPALAVVRAWQRWLRAGLNQLERGEDWPIRLGSRRWRLSYGARGLERQEYWSLDHQWQEATQVFHDEVAHTLGELGRRFRFCVHCGHAFVARRRQTYCGSTCSQTFRTRKYRQTHREAFNWRRRQAYARRRPASMPPHATSPTTPSRSAPVGRVSRNRPAD